MAAKQNPLNPFSGKALLGQLVSDSKPLTAETVDNEHCRHCGVAVYRTLTAQGTRWAHVGTKVLFCTRD